VEEEGGKGDEGEGETGWADSLRFDLALSVLCWTAVLLRLRNGLGMLDKCGLIVEDGTGKGMVDANAAGVTGV
jgi:hypothetical protein